MNLQWHFIAPHLRQCHITDDDGRQRWLSVKLDHSGWWIAPGKAFTAGPFRRLADVKAYVAEAPKAAFLYAEQREHHTHATGDSHD